MASNKERALRSLPASRRRLFLSCAPMDACSSKNAESLSFAKTVNRRPSRAYASAVKVTRPAETLSSLKFRCARMRNREENSAIARTQSPTRQRRALPSYALAPGTREFFASSRISNPNLALRRQGRGCGVGRGRGVGVGLTVGDGVTVGLGVIDGVGVTVGVGVGDAPQGLTGQLKISIEAIMARVLS
jgi:hypothetical protein